MMQYAPPRIPSFIYTDGRGWSQLPPQHDGPAFPLFDPTTDEPVHRNNQYIDLTE